METENISVNADLTQIWAQERAESHFLGALARAGQEAKIVDMDIVIEIKRMFHRETPA